MAATPRTARESARRPSPAARRFMSPAGSEGAERRWFLDRVGEHGRRADRARVGGAGASWPPRPPDAGPTARSPYDRRVTLLSRRSAASSTAAGPIAPVVLERFPPSTGCDRPTRPNACATCRGSRSSNPLAADGWAAGPSSPRIPSRSSKQPDLGVARRALARLDGSAPAPRRRRRLASMEARRSSAASSATSATGCARCSSPGWPPALPPIRGRHRACRTSTSRSTTGSSRGTSGPAPPGSVAARSTETQRRLAARLADVRARLADVAPVPLRPAPSLAPFRSSLARPRVRGRSRGRPRRDRARRDLPGQPHPAPRHAVRGRPVAAPPAARGRRPGAVRLVPRPRRPAGRSSRPRPRRSCARTRAATFAPTRSRARAAAGARARRTARSRASCWRARRTAPRT